MEVALVLVILAVIILVQAGFHLLIMPLLLQITLGALSLGAFSFIQSLAIWLVAMAILKAITKVIKSFRSKQ